MEELHVDLIRRISSHHMQYHQSTARVLVEPAIELQDIFIHDDNVFSLKE